MDTIPDIDAADLAMLDELVRMGMDIARMVHAQAAAHPEDFDAGAVTSAYAKAARAVRLTLLLKQRLAKSDSGEQVRVAELNGWVAARKEIVIELARHAIARSGRGGHRLLGDLRERLDRESEDTLFYSPVREIVAKVCAEFGVEVPWDVEPEAAASEPALGEWTEPRPP